MAEALTQMNKVHGGMDDKDKAQSQQAVGQGVASGHTRVHKMRQRAAGSLTKTRKSTRTRQRIIEAARQIIDEHGSVDFQMSEVADRCKMSKGALYYYFRDRRAIIEVVNNGIAEAILRTVSDAASQPTAVGALHEICISFGHALGEDARGISALAEDFARSGYQSFNGVESRYGRLVSLAAGLIERGKREGSVRGSLDCNLAAHGIIGMFLFAAISCAYDHRDIDSDEYAAQLESLVLAGVGGGAQ